MSKKTKQIIVIAVAAACILPFVLYAAVSLYAWLFFGAEMDTGRFTVAAYMGAFGSLVGSLFFIAIGGDL